MASFKTALDYFNEGNGQRRFQTTGNAEIDYLIGGGVAFGTLTEVSGEAGVGKSQFCMQLAANALAAGRKVLYIDTEKGSSLKRIAQLYGHCSPQDDWKSVCQSSRIAFAEPSSIQTLAIQLTQCSTDKENASDLLVLDSITSPFRGESLREQACELDIVAVALCRIATELRAAVVCTNHVTTKFDSQGNDFLDPSLGAYWSHRPTSRIWMERVEQRRYMELEKSPIAGQKKAEFAIEGKGIRIYTR